MKRNKITFGLAILLVIANQISFAQQYMMYVSVVQDFTDKDGKETREYNETFYDFTFPQPLKYKDKGFYSAAFKDQPSSIIPVDFEFYSTKDDIYFSIHTFFPPLNDHQP